MLDYIQKITVVKLAILSKLHTQTIAAESNGFSLWDNAFSLVVEILQIISYAKN